MRARGAGLAGRYTRVVTGCTVAAVDTEVIESNTSERGEIVGDMARRTIQPGRHVTGRLADTDIIVMT